MHKLQGPRSERRDGNNHLSFFGGAIVREISHMSSLDLHAHMSECLTGHPEFQQLP